MTEPTKTFDTITCAQCGEEVRFSGNQYSRHCPRCGNFIENPKRVAVNKQISCSICRDTGLVVILKQDGDALYEYGYRCVCSKGRSRPESGIPLAVNVDISKRL